MTDEPKFNQPCFHELNTVLDCNLVECCPHKERGVSWPICECGGMSSRYEEYEGEEEEIVRAGDKMRVNKPDSPLHGKIAEVQGEDIWYSGAVGKRMLCVIIEGVEYRCTPSRLEKL